MNIYVHKCIYIHEYIWIGTHIKIILNLHHSTTKWKVDLVDFFRGFGKGRMECHGRWGWEILANTIATDPGNATAPTTPANSLHAVPSHPLPIPPPSSTIHTRVIKDSHHHLFWNITRYPPTLANHPQRHTLRAETAATAPSYLNCFYYTPSSACRKVAQ